MPVVFDEVVGEVEPETGGGGEERPLDEPAATPMADELWRKIRQLERREARLKAD